MEKTVNDMTQGYLDNFKPTLPNLLQEFVVDQDLSKEEYAYKTYKLLLTAKRNSEALFLVIIFMIYLYICHIKQRIFLAISVRKSLQERLEMQNFAL